MPVEPTPPSEDRSPSGRNWNAISGISAVVGVVLAIVTGLIGFFAFISPRSAAPTPPRLSLVDVSVKPGTEIQYSPAADENPRDFSDFAITDNRIDVQLQNEGGAPELIKSVEASVVYAQMLDLCIGIGGPGSVLEAATEYGISVPTSPAPTESDLPLALGQSTPVVVEPNSFGRIAVAIGPDIVRASPWIYVFDLSVITRSGRVDVGRFTFVTPTSQIKALYEDLASLDRPTQAECSRDGLTKILKAANLKGMAAPEVIALQQRYTELAMLRPGEDLAGQIAPSDSWERTTGAAIQCGGIREAHGDVIHFGDLNGDQVKDAIVALTCNKEPGTLSPESIEVFDGRLVNGEPRSIGVLLTGAQLRGVYGLGRGVSIDSAGVIRIDLVGGDRRNLSRQFAVVSAFRYTTDQRFVALGDVRCITRDAVPVEVPCPGLGGR